MSDFFQNEENIRIFIFWYCVATMFLHSPGLPGTPETASFRCFGGPGVVLKTNGRGNCIRHLDLKIQKKTIENPRRNYVFFVEKK